MTDNFTPLWNVKPGDIVLTWCRIHMQRTDHVYNPMSKTPLTCLDCYPEKDPRPVEEKNEHTN